MPATASIRTFETSLAQLDAAGFDAADVLLLAKRRPSSFAKLAVRTPGPMLTVLEQLDVTDAAVLLRAQPQLLALDAPRVVAAASFIKRYVGGFERVGAFVTAHPEALLWRDDGACVVAEHLRLLGVPERAIRRAANSFPQLTQLTSADNVDRLMAYLSTELGLTAAALGALIGSYPQLLGLSLEANIRPKVRFLVEELGVDPSRLLARHPQLLGLSLQVWMRARACSAAASRCGRGRGRGHAHRHAHQRLWRHVRRHVRRHARRALPRHGPRPPPGRLPTGMGHGFLLTSLDGSPCGSPTCCRPYATCVSARSTWARR